MDSLKNLISRKQTYTFVPSIIGMVKFKSEKKVNIENYCRFSFHVLHLLLRYFQ